MKSKCMLLAFTIQIIAFGPFCYADENVTNVLIALGRSGYNSIESRMHDITNGWRLPFSLDRSDIESMSQQQRISILNMLEQKQPWKWEPHNGRLTETDQMILRGYHDGKNWKYFTNAPDENLDNLLMSFASIVSEMGSDMNSLRFHVNKNTDMAMLRQLSESNWFLRRIISLPRTVDYHISASKTACIRDWLSIIQFYDYNRVQNWWFDLDGESVQMYDASFDELPSMPALIMWENGDISSGVIKPKTLSQLVVVSNQIEKIENKYVTYPVADEEKAICLVCKRSYSLLRLTKIALVIKQHGYSPIFVESRWINRLPSTVVLNEKDTHLNRMYQSDIEFMTTFPNSTNETNVERNLVDTGRFSLPELFGDIMSDLVRMSASMDEENALACETNVSVSASANGTRHPCPPQ